MTKLEYVHVSQGTESTFQFSYGNTIPITGIPFSQAYFCPETESDDPSRFFKPDKTCKIKGIRLTHQPSPWIGDFANLLVSIWKPKTETKLLAHSPALIRVKNQSNDDILTLAPTPRCALFSCSFSKYSNDKREIYLTIPYHTFAKLEIKENSVYGITSANNGGNGGPNFGLRFVATLRNNEWIESVKLVHDTTNDMQDLHGLAPQIVFPHGYESGQEQILYIARKWMNNKFIVGKAAKHLGGMNFGLNGKENFCSNQYELLSIFDTTSPESAFHWVDMQMDATIPTLAVVAFYNDDKNPAYVARGLCGGGMHPGYWTVDKKDGMETSYGGATVRMKTFQLLVRKDENSAVRWVTASHGIIPKVPLASKLLCPPILPANEWRLARFVMNQRVHIACISAALTQLTPYSKNMYDLNVNLDCLRIGYMNQIEYNDLKSWVDLDDLGDIKNAVVLEQKSEQELILVGRIKEKIVQIEYDTHHNTIVSVYDAIYVPNNDVEINLNPSEIDFHQIKGLKILVSSPNSCFMFDPVICDQLPPLDDVTTIELQNNETKPQALKAVFEIKSTVTETVLMSLCTSFVSHEQAKVNQRKEIEMFQSVDEVSTQAKFEWERYLETIDITRDVSIQPSHSDLCTFYSCLYRCFLYPQCMHEEDETGKLIHYSAYSGKIETGTSYTNQGFWDVHRTVLPLLTIVDPVLYGNIVQGYINAYKESGWLPKWASPGYRSCMVGTHIDNVIADGIVKGICNFEHDIALEAMQKNSNCIGDPGGLYGRVGVHEYNTLGFVPSDKYSGSVSRTLDFAMNDFGIAQACKYLQQPKEIVQLYENKAKRYKNVFHPDKGTVCCRNTDRSWDEQQGEFEWGGGYVEGGMWQTTFSVPHDIQGLASVMGGADLCLRKLQKLFDLPPIYEVGSYGYVIHEMREMASYKGLGQYNAGNQPQHHYPYLFAQLGDVATSRKYIAKICEDLYNATAKGFPGDEDNGEMGAWYIFSSLGIYPICPGLPEYTVVCPRFPRIDINTKNGKSISIRSNVDKTDKISRVELNGSCINDGKVLHNDLLADKVTLKFFVSK